MNAKHGAWTALAFLAALAASACGAATADERAEVPEGTALTVRLDQTLNSQRHGSGTLFTATVTDPVVREATVLIPSGAKVHGEILAMTEDPPRLEVAFKELEVRGEKHLLEAELASVTPREHSEMKGEAKKIGGGAAAGALLGGVVGGSAKGAVIGAAAGAAAGTGIALATKDKHVYLPAGSLFRLELSRPLEVSLGEPEAGEESGSGR